MNRVGLVTFHHPINYGARLQAFALQEAVKKCGAECSIINYLPKSETVPAPLSFPRRLYRTVTKLRFGRRIRRLESEFAEWSDSHLSLTQPIHSEAELRTISEKFDTFICGSDQIWRDPERGFYYLDFTPDSARRIAYAPSFGNIHYNPESKKLIRNHLERFQILSVREQDGAEFLTDLIGKSIPSLLDPTLLWGIDFWRASAAEPPYRLPKRYALIFTVQDTIPCFTAAKKICKRLQLQPVIVDTAQRLVWHPLLKNFFDISPSEFIHLVDLSRFVITTSFHGTAFAVNFNKPFLTICRNGPENVNSRILSLADKLGVKDRILLPEDEISEPIYSELKSDTEKHLISERKRCFDFLSNSIV